MAKKKATKKAVRKAKSRKVAKVAKKVTKAARKKVAKKAVKKTTRRVAARTAAPKPTPAPAPAPPPPPPVSGPAPEPGAGGTEGSVEPPSGTTLPAVGDPAPYFALPDQSGRVHTLEDYRGRTLVLYFYPKDQTSGCTTEACEFRDHTPEFQRRNVAVLGVSPDPVDSHQAFAGKLGLNFPLLADPDRTAVRRYGVWQPRPGTGQMGVARTTFIIDPQGRIAHVFRNVNPAGHALEILGWLDQNAP